MLFNIKETGLRPVSNDEIPGRIVEKGLKPFSISNQIKRHGISEFVRALKSFSTKQINVFRNDKYPIIWQSGFYDHIIRNDKELFNTREYIVNNPLNWFNDEINIIEKKVGIKQ